MGFFDNGLKFSCKGCNYCCAGSPGFVFISEKELDEIAAFLKLDLDVLKNSYTRKIIYQGEERISLKEKSNFKCVFLSNEGCLIYPVRPLQCRTYPFWPSIMASEKEWLEEKESCPGIGDGRLYSKEEIEEILALMKENEKDKDQVVDS